MAFNPSVFGKKNESCGNEGHSAGSYEAKQEAALRYAREKGWIALRFDETDHGNIPYLERQLMEWESGSPIVDDSHVNILNRHYDSMDKLRASRVFILKKDAAQFLLANADRTINIDAKPGTGVGFSRARLAGIWGNFGGWIMMSNVRRTAIEGRRLTQAFADFLRTKKHFAEQDILAEIRVHKVRGKQGGQDNKGLALKVGLITELDKFQKLAHEWLQEEGGELVQGNETYIKAMEAEGQWGSWATINADRTLIAHKVLARKLAGKSQHEKAAAARVKLEIIMVESGAWMKAEDAKAALEQVEWLRDASGSTGRIKMLVATSEEAKELKGQATAIEAAMGGGQVCVEWEGKGGQGGQAGYVSTRISDRGTAAPTWSPPPPLIQMAGTGLARVDTANMDVTIQEMSKTAAYKQMIADVANECLGTSLAEYREGGKMIKATMQRSERKVDEVKEGVQGVGTKVDNLQKELLAKMEHIENQLGGYYEEEEGLKQHIEMLEGDKWQLEESERWYREHYEELEAMADTEHARKVIQEKKQLEDWGSQLLQQVRKLEDQIEAADKDNAKQSEWVAMQVALKESEDRRLAAEGEAEKFKAEAEKAKGGLDGAKMRMSRMQVMHDEKVKEKDDEHRKQLQKLEVQRQNVELGMQDLQERRAEYEYADAENKRLRKALKQAEEKIKIMETDTDRRKWATANLDGEVQESRAMIKTLQDRLEAAHDAESSQKVKCERWEEACLKAEQDRDENERSYQDWKSRYKDVEEEATTMREELRQAKRELDRLRGKKSEEPNRSGRSKRKTEQRQKDSAAAEPEGEQTAVKAMSSADKKGQDGSQKKQTTKATTANPVPEAGTPQRVQSVLIAKSESSQAEAGGMEVDTMMTPEAQAPEARAPVTGRETRDEQEGSSQEGYLSITNKAVSDIRTYLVNLNSKEEAGEGISKEGEEGQKRAAEEKSGLTPEAKRKQVNLAAMPTLVASQPVIGMMSTKMEEERAVAETSTPLDGWDAEKDDADRMQVLAQGMVVEAEQKQLTREQLMEQFMELKEQGHTDLLQELSKSGECSTAARNEPGEGANGTQ